MSTVTEIQAAVERLSASERVALYHWLEKSDAVHAEKRRLLLAEIDAGLAEAERSELIPGEAVIQHLKDRARGAA